MRAIGYERPLPIDHEEALIQFETPLPTLRPRDLLVRIEAVSVNPVDVKVRATAPPTDKPAHILGYDAAGVVQKVGSEASLFREGDAIFYAGARNRPGSNAEFHAVDERLVALKPASLSFAAAAAMPLTSLTAWELLFEKLAVPFGQRAFNDTILIINGAGGVGSILTQLARRLTGLTVIATASRPESQAWCRQMGAHHVIDHRRPLPEELANLGIPQVRYVASLTASEQNQAAIIDCLQPFGSLALIDDPQKFDIVMFKRKSLSVHWESMFTRSSYTTADMGQQGRILAEVSSLLEARALQTTLRQELGPITLTNLRRAHAAVESGKSIGKNVLSGFDL